MVKEDNLQLIVCGVDYGDLVLCQLLCVVVDSCLQIYLIVNVFKGVKDGSLVLVVGVVEDVLCIVVLCDVGVDVLIIFNEYGKVELYSMLCVLVECGINEIYGEVGFKLNGLLLCEGCVDEFFIYQVFMLVGDNVQGMFNLYELSEFSQVMCLKIIECMIIGDDMCMLV